MPRVESIKVKFGRKLEVDLIAILNTAIQRDTSSVVLKERSWLRVPPFYMIIFLWLSNFVGSLSTTINRFGWF